MTPKKLIQKLQLRAQQNCLRKLQNSAFEVDFFSNDYLGFAKNQPIFKQVSEILEQKKLPFLGATGSRLISGNYQLLEETEQHIAKHHFAEAALVFNSGYDANIGLLSSVPQKGDLILYDALVHASIIDGIQLSHAKSYKYAHANNKALGQMLHKFKSEFEHIYVVTESVFSMDGDSPDLTQWVEIVNKHQAFGIVDEAHALGLYSGGLVQQLNLENHVFARVFTYGKALGCHGASVVGSTELKNYLVNFARSFIYTTAPSYHQTANILVGYLHLQQSESLQKQLIDNICCFQELMKMHCPEITTNFSPIQIIKIGGNEATKQLANLLKNEAFGIKEVLHPTVPLGTERIRICLHSYNNRFEIEKLVQILSQQLKKSHE